MAILPHRLRDHRSLLRKSLFAIALGAFLLAPGCGRKQEAVTKDGRTIIRFWQFWTEPRVRAVITKAVEEFEAQNPAYKVEVTDLTWNDGYQKIVAAFAANRVPDLLELGSDWIAEFADRGALLDMTNECMRMKDQYGGWPPAIYQGNCWALPWYLSTRVFYQNDDINRYIAPTKPHPIVWSELLERAQDATVQKPKMWGFGVNAAEPHRLYKRFLPFLWSAGGSVLTEDEAACAMETESGRRALQFMVDLSDGGYVDKQAALDDMFIAGKLLYHFSGDWLYEKIKRSGSNMKFSAFVMPFPAPGQGTRTSFAGGEYLAIPRRANEPVPALNLARLLLGEKYVFNLCIAAGGATPVLLKVAQDPYFARDSIRSVFIAQMNMSQSPPANAHWLEIEAVIESGVEQALYKKRSVDDVLADMCERINKILSTPKKK